MKARSRVAVAFLFTLSILLVAPSVAQSQATVEAGYGMSSIAPTRISGLQLLRAPDASAEATGAANFWSSPHTTIRVLRPKPPGSNDRIYVIDISRNVLDVLDSNWAVVATFDGPRTDPDAISIDPPDIPYFGRANLATAPDRDLWSGSARVNQ